MLKKFDKSKAVPECQGTIMAVHLLTREIEGYIDELIWGFLKKNIKVHPHKHPQKEVYIFIRGNGTIQVNDNKMPIGRGDIVFIPPNAMHTVWNADDEDLEFILVRTKKSRSLRMFAKILANY